MQITVNKAEHATILAALRFWQRKGNTGDEPENDIATDGGDMERPLDDNDIDELCERINLGGDSRRAAYTMAEIDSMRTAINRALTPINVSYFRKDVEEAVERQLRTLMEAGKPAREVCGYYNGIIQKQMDQWFAEDELRRRVSAAADDANEQADSSGHDAVAPKPDAATLVSASFSEPPLSPWQRFIKRWLSP